jgi:hypothetical protein
MFSLICKKRILTLNYNPEKNYFFLLNQDFNLVL